MNINTIIGAIAHSSPPARKERQVIAERIYSGYQPSRFVRTCRYVIREGIPLHSAGAEQLEEGTNSLLLELENRLDVNVSAVRVKVTQLDAEGQEIGETQHTFRGLCAAPGAVFVPPEAIFLRPACTSVTIRVLYADAAPYRYRICGDMPEVTLIRDEDVQDTRDGAFRANDRAPTVKDKIPRGYRLMSLAVLAVAVILLALSVYSVLYGFVGEAVNDFLLNNLWRPVKWFFTEQIPDLFREIFVEAIPNGFRRIFIEQIPSWFREFFTETVPGWFEEISSPFS